MVNNGSLIQAAVSSPDSIPLILNSAVNVRTKESAGSDNIPRKFKSFAEKGPRID